VVHENPAIDRRSLAKPRSQAKVVDSHQADTLVAGASHDDGGARSGIWQGSGGIRFDPSSGKPIGQAFQVSRFDSPGLVVPQQIPPVALSITEEKMALTLADSSGGIWVLDHVDR
jgi:hypothetical protein